MTGTTLADFKRYSIVVNAYYLGRTSEEGKAAVGPELYRNLIVCGGELAQLMEQLDVETIAKDGGHKSLLKFMEDRRFKDTKLKELPRVYDKFYEGTRFKRSGEEPMSA